MFQKSSCSFLIYPGKYQIDRIEYFYKSISSNDVSDICQRSFVSEIPVAQPAELLFSFTAFIVSIRSVIQIISEYLHFCFKIRLAKSVFLQDNDE